MALDNQQKGEDFVHVWYFGEDESRLLRDSNKNDGYVPFDVVMRQFGNARKPSSQTFVRSLELEQNLQGYC